jgi:hypothetical protein
MKPHPARPQAGGQLCWHLHIAGSAIFKTPEVHFRRHIIKRSFFSSGLSREAAPEHAILSGLFSRPDYYIRCAIRL